MRVGVILMPIYEYRCQDGHEFERVLPVADYRTPQTCECGKPSRRILSLPSVYVRPDICYTSPIDGRPITSKQQRIEDLKRNDCVEYDPEMKTDYNRRIAEREAALDKSVEQTVEAAVEKMDVRKRERLAAELQSDVDCKIERREVKGGAAHV